ncbi:MAG: YfcE family phosphodiesterase [Clostridia bacterium]|nr:YfcE family phosphodiesterase [Clostridia bacterium]
MRLLVLSDSHGDAISCRAAIRRHPEAEFLIHLGDGADDLDFLHADIGDKKLVRIRGNNDWSNTYPLQYILNTCGKRIYCCHGHMEGVKRALDGFVANAMEARCDIALYGHTHIQHYEKFEGLHIFNPGSIRAGCYGAIDVADGGIMCLEMRLR